MTLTEWFLVFLIVQVIHFLGTWKLYVKAGRKAWEAAVPVYNAVVLMDIINRPKWWVILLFVPIVNLLMFPIVWIETCRSFGFNKRPHTILAVATLGFFIYYINYATDAKYIKDRSLKPRSVLGEWISSIAFAIIAATLVHTYFIQPYTIPTSSLEKTLLVGDYLFVSKFHYGARVPMTTVSAPMVHDTIPFVGKSFLSDDKDKDGLLNKLTLPYMRLPGFQKIKRNEIVVFSWPVDSLASMWGDNSGKPTYKPIDKKTNYVKRAVGIPGDSLEVRDGYVYINGKRTELPDRAKPQWFFKIYSKKGLSTEKLLRYTYKEFQRKYYVKVNSNTQFEAIRRIASNIISLGNNVFEVTTSHEGIPQWYSQQYRLKPREINTKVREANLTDEIATKLLKDSDVDSLIKKIEPKGIFDKSVFPHNVNYKWSSDNFGPIYIPKKGTTVALNAKTIPFYEQVIGNYEGNNLTVMNDDIYINGKKADSYTFKQDYYWMMGDNRQNSLDARNWGYVPFDHVVGKPVMIWLSWDADAPSFMAKLKSIRWDRMFTTVHGDGKPVSYLWLVVILIIAYTGYSFFKGRKAK